MINITASMVKELRKLTGLGILECKKALLEVKGNINLAIDKLHQVGKIKAFKKSSKKTTEGIILVKVNNTNTYGVIIELNCETDFVAKDINFYEFGNEITTKMLNEHIIDINLLKKKFEEKRISLINKMNENIIISKASMLKGNYIESYIHRSRIGVLVSTTKFCKNLIKYIAMHIAASQPIYINDIPDNILKKESEIYFNLAIKSNKSVEISKKITQGRIHKLKQEICLYKQPFIMDNSKTVGQLLNEYNINIKNFIRFEIGK